MVSKIERQKDVISFFEKLDISPTMYKSAIKKYNSITKHLETSGIDADMYIQGSFALGTVVRPYSEDCDKGYDMDVVCKLRYSKNDITAKSIRDEVREILTSSDLYGGKMEEYKECFTIVYSDINDVSFSIDIVPATDEELDKKNRLRDDAEFPELMDTAIAIPKGDIDWLTNNPLGYRKWFRKINDPFIECNKEERRKLLFESARQAYATIEEVPEDLDRTVVQRVIQIMKHHRNVYYSNLSDGQSLKPNSAILTTIVAKIAEQVPVNIEVFDLLASVLKELEIYSAYQNTLKESFEIKYPVKKLIYQDKDRKWHIDNPANPEDNLADSWNNKNGKAERFFKWIGIMKKDLIESLDLDDDKYGTVLESAFGHDLVNKNIEIKKYSKTTPGVLTSDQQKSPWKI